MQQLSCTKVSSVFPVEDYDVKRDDGHWSCSAHGAENPQTLLPGGNIDGKNYTGPMWPASTGTCRLGAEDRSYRVGTIAAG